MIAYILLISSLTCRFAVFGQHMSEKPSLVFFSRSRVLARVNCLAAGNYVPRWDGIAVVTEDYSLAAATPGGVRRIADCPLPASNDPFAVSSDGQRLAAYDGDTSSLDIFDVQSGKLLRSTTVPMLRAAGLKVTTGEEYGDGVVFSEDRRYVAVSFPGVETDEVGWHVPTVVVVSLNSSTERNLGEGVPLAYTKGRLIIESPDSSSVSCRGNRIHLPEGTWVGASPSCVLAWHVSNGFHVTVWKADLSHVVDRFAITTSGLPVEFVKQVIPIRTSG